MVSGRELNGECFLSISARPGRRFKESSSTMPTTPHVEKHFTSSAIVRDIVIGMSDGLTVPFALAAGLTGAVDTTTIIITAGIAEIAAGSIAMGLGGYLAGRTDMEHFKTHRPPPSLDCRVAR